MADKHPGIGVPCWHIHHGQLLEGNTEPLAERAKYIREKKPAHEVETRLRLMRPVKGPLPGAVAEAWDAHGKALEAHHEARIAHFRAKDAYHKAWCVCNEALDIYRDEIEALHTKECPNCPWDGKTIFPAIKGEEVRNA